MSMSKTNKNYVDDLQEIGALVKSFRNEKKETIFDFSKSLGISHPPILAIENAKTDNPNLPILSKILQSMGYRLSINVEKI